MLDYQNKQRLCIRLTVIYEKVTLTRKKNTIKILPKRYESATSDSRTLLLIDIKMKNNDYRIKSQ